MNEVIAVLEGKKLIARRESPGHRRILHVRLKASGTRLLQKCDGEVDRIERSAFHGFSPTELKAFRGMISKALSSFEQDVGSPEHARIHEIAHQRRPPGKCASSIAREQSNPDFATRRHLDWPDGSMTRWRCMAHGWNQWEEDNMSKVTRRTVLAGGLSAVVATPARSDQNWPDRPVTMVHGFPPGGTVDLVARIVADGLSRRLGQPVVVEGRSGASGITAALAVARAAPNGYTLFAIPSGHAVVAATFKSLPYRAVDDFTAIGMTTEYPYVMVTYADNPVRTVGDLLRVARSRDTPLLYGTPGNGSGPHLAIEMLAKVANIRTPARALSWKRTGGHRSDRQAARFHDGPAGSAA